MKAHEYKSLTSTQQTTLLIAMLVRTNMEPFHIEHLSNPQMKELNQLVRSSIYEAVELIQGMNTNLDQAAYFKWLVGRIPDYWEIPGTEPRAELVDQSST